MLYSLSIFFSGRTVVPKDNNELKNYLNSKEKLIINLDKTYDFTASEGYGTERGCFYKKCKKVQISEESLTRSGTCNGRLQTQVKYAKAGTSELWVSSYKTILTTNGKGAIKGKGLRLKNAQQVIVRDITISDINPQVIWGGDALVFDNVQNAWIHRVTTVRIGRQHLVSYQQTNVGITVSSCFFDGTNQYSATCDNTQYWVWLFWGTRDEITLINNRVYNTAARVPHAGGWAKAWNNIHLIGNFMDNNPHTGLEPHMGSNILAEGNLFSRYKRIINGRAHGGHLALVDNAQEANTCVKYFGQKCLVNKYEKSRAAKRFDESVLVAFKSLDRTAINGARKAVCI
ncbi:pectin lyase B-like isoform X1 [Thrips palmi]|uniref:pectin lyase n=1 Tax=Thrips palmi TaxID=161013 RepID=A0A6P8ZUB2_THRPL|nr:pectin lyase B-like isoform X1 [Thrips palmi]